MTLWGRRFLVFVLVLGVVLMVAQSAHRLTAHASPRRGPAVDHSSGGAPVVPPLSGEPQVAGAPPAMGPGTTRAVERSRISAGSAAAGKPAAGLLGGTGGTRTFHDRNYKVSFEFPANWTFAEKDHEISTFRLDARSADKKTLLRAVTALPENPYPASTFTGAYVYLSVTPHTNEAKCAAQAETAKSKKELSEVGGMSFAHGHTEQKQICTVERDEVYTTYRKGACYRFDLAMNNFCGGEVSGVKDVTEQELDTVLTRMESIMGTVRFDPK